MRLFLLLLTLCTVFNACEPSYTAKPRSYPRIEIPSKKYDWYISDQCPYTFKYPSQYTISQEEKYFDETLQTPCWINISYAPFKQRFHLSYKPIDTKNTLEKLESEARKLTNKHIQKADFIDPTRVLNQYGVEGILFDVGGNAASALQFYVSDRKQHFVRGALYFYSSVNADSMQPMIVSSRADLDTFLQTIHWK
jgi:gliding motility-associated lipoprotein GldD